MESIAIIDPMTRRLALALQPDTTPAEQATRARRAIAVIDAATGPARSTCGRCWAPISTTALRCDGCAFGLLAVEHRVVRT
jgi:hypothetical protein